MMWRNLQYLAVVIEDNKKFCVKKMREKCVTFCSIKLNAKISPIPSGNG